ncbi:DUF3085 domain-containing protein [Acidithiobacillus caldus]|uniref:DUF3085 domain-containing protein n=1 Tax=Acidithiobacillus caldus TaxID=33059 RepID=A0A1E7YNM2_9PROT|nr:DUF3085 domain-containing protein [Acidithiobacillus caldus]OFC36615.1 hypothetical protein BAE27_05980 [Acidithiobacillus caldus]OFC38229.1 hypothetical protein BAE29_09235 [Acidithiobacillus caldus]OFC39313.1 hypothetical protein BAE28_03850 [Acidithiobacillus caldus]OFC62422.1 hypothetical protein BAE30_02040 [Acidithiobacillus caldus]
MMLRFLPADIEVQVQHAQSCVQHEPTYTQSQRASFHKGGKVKRDSYGDPDLSNVDKARIPPALWLVKDHGVYLMSNGLPRLLADPEHNPTQGLAAYALGFCPEKNPDWYARLGSLEGDDFCDLLPLEPFTKLLRSGKRYVTLNVTESRTTVF